MTVLGEDVYTDRSTALDALTEESQRMGMYGDAPDGVAELIEAAGIALYDRMWNRTRDGGLYELELIDSKRHALAALESLGIPLSVLAAIRAGEWVAVPKEPTCGPERGTMSRAGAIELSDASMRTAVRVYRAMLSAAPKTPEATR